MSRAIIGVRICLILELSDALGETSMVQVAFIPLPDYQEQSPEEMNHRAAEFYDDLRRRRRRTVREFSDQPVPVEGPRRHGWTRWLRWGRTSTSRSSRLRHF